MLDANLGIFGSTGDGKAPRGGEYSQKAQARQIMEDVENRGAGRDRAATCDLTQSHKTEKATRYAAADAEAQLDNRPRTPTLNANEEQRREMVQRPSKALKDAKWVSTFEIQKMNDEKQEGIRDTEGNAGAQ